MRNIAYEMADMLENGSVLNYGAIAQIAQELRRLADENKELKAQLESMKADYETASIVLHSGEYEDVSMLKPLANKAVKVMKELTLPQTFNQKVQAVIDAIEARRVYDNGYRSLALDALYDLLHK